MTPEGTKKKLLIIKATAKGLIAVETFLKNRDWEIKSTNNLKEALLFLVQNQPEFVMISIDHPNKKVRNMPKVLAQAFPACVMVFTEDTSAAAHQALANCKTKYMLYPPVTGPAVERMVNRYYKDLQNEGYSSTSQAFEAKKNQQGDNVIAIRGAGAAAEGSTENLLASLFAEDSESIVQSGVKSESHMSGDGHGAGQAHSSLTDGDLAAALRSSQDDASGGSTLSSSQDSVTNNKKQSPLWAPIEQNAMKQRQSRSSEDIHADPRSNKTDSLIFKGTKDALEKSTVVGRRIAQQDILTASRSACITIESNRFGGYLLTVSTSDIDIDEQFISQIRQRLFKFLQANGEKIEDRELMNLKLQPVPFEDWALEQAEFLRKSTHKGQDIAMAFFPRDSVKNDWTESQDQKMLLVPLEQIKEDTEVEFNLYVYLPKNNKYVLYTPRGGVFYGVQKERLIQQGISNIHISKIEAAGLEKYQAQNFLNDKINEYEKNLETA